MFFGILILENESREMATNIIVVLGAIFVFQNQSKKWDKIVVWKIRICDGV